MNKKKTSPAHFNQINETKMTYSKAELREMIKAEVQNAKKQSEAKLDGLLEKIEQLANDKHYDCAMGKMEIQIEKLKRRADAAIDHVMQLDVNGSQDAPRPKIPSLPAAGTAKLKISRSDSAEASERTASHINKDSTAGKVNRKLLQAIEATKNTMGMVKVEYEALKVTNDDLEENTSMKTTTECLTFHETPAVPIKEESDSTEWSVGGHLGVGKVAPQEQTIAVKTEVEPVDVELRPPKHLEPEAFTYPPLPATPFPAVLNMEAASYSCPPQLSLQLALIRKPPGLSLLWNAEVGDPSAPPMESYSVYVAMEVVKGSGVFPEWKTLGVVKAIPLPMCIMITWFRRGCKACFTVVGKDTFGRYGPYSKIMLAEVPEQTPPTALSRLRGQDEPPAKGPH